MAAKHKWEFKARFGRHAFGWKSQPAIKRVKEAASEIKKVARGDPALAAEGAVTFLERVSPALEQVDSSSGAIGTAVNNAIAVLSEIIASAPADAATRDAWLQRLWNAYQDDGIPYIESLGDHWGELCASKEVASQWADQLVGVTKMAWSPDPNLRGYFKGTTNCLSALLAAGRYDELLELLEIAPYPMWHYRKFGMKALAAQGKTDEALRYAESGRGLNDSWAAIAGACEEILLSAGRTDEAYEKYAIMANRSTTYLAWFRALAKKYPSKGAVEILTDLVAATPGEEGKWFAAAKDAKLFQEALDLAARTPCDPRTLTRAARDYVVTEPAFAVEAGLLSLHWLVQGYGHDISSLDVRAAYSHTLAAGEKNGNVDEVRERIRGIVASETFGERFVTKVLDHELGL